MPPLVRCWNRRAAIAAAAVVTLAGARGLFLSLLVPAFHGPDEPAHFDYIQHVAETRRLPDLAPGIHLSEESRALERAWMHPIVFRPEIPLPPFDAFHPPAGAAARMTTGFTQIAAYPPAYYATGVVAYRSVHNASLLRRLWAVRLASVAWGCAGALFAFFMGLHFFGRSREGVLIGLIVALQPMVGFLSAVVNNDAALFACASACLATLAWLRAGTSPRIGKLALACSAIAGVLVKPTFALYLPAFAGITLVIFGIRRWRSWLTTAAVFVPAAAIHLAWSLRTRALVRQMFSGATSQLTLSKWAALRLSPAAIEDLWIRTYWMAWGWLDTQLPIQHYRAIEMLLAVAAAGLVLGFRLLSQEERWATAVIIAITLLSMGALHVMDYVIMRGTGMTFAQGRYLLPLFPAHALLLVIGLRAASRPFGIDASWAAVLLAVALQGAAVARTLERFYA